MKVCHCVLALLTIFICGVCNATATNKNIADVSGSGISIGSLETTISAALGDEVTNNAIVIAPNGDDNNPCTVAEPCATINRASSLVKPGGTVYWRSGTYIFSGEQDITSVGTVDAPIVWTLYPNDATPAIFTGGDQSQWGTLLRISQTGPATYNMISNFTADCGAWGSNYTTPMGATSTGPNGKTITYPYNGPPSCATVVALDGISDGNSTQNTVNNTLSDCNLTGARDDAIVDSSSYLTITGCSIYHNANDNNPANVGFPYSWRLNSGGGGGSWPGAIGYRGDHTLTQNSIIYENYGEGALLGGNTATFQNNILHDNFGTNVGCDGVTQGQCVIANNWIYSTDLVGFERYRFTGPAPAVGIGMGTEGGTNASVLVINNVVYGGWINYSYYNDTNQTSCYNNYVVVGNTFVNPVGPTNSYQININIEVGGDNGPTNCNPQSGNMWKDNIAAVYNGNPQINIDESTGTIPMSYDHNDWVGGGGGPLAGGVGDSTSDPQFVGPISGATTATNFNLVSGSPLIGAGTSTAPYASVDYAGEPRPNGNGAWDMGAFNP